MGWFRIRRRRRRASTVTKHYLTHKEAARVFIHERISYWNQFYSYEYKRVAIRNTRTRWGSCSEHGNLNFSYKLLFLPEHLADYIIVHELCHLEELNHGRNFWSLVERTIPQHRTLRKELRALERMGLSRYLQQQRAAVLMVPEGERREGAMR